MELKASLQCQQWSVESRGNDRLRGPERYWNRGVCRHLSVLFWSDSSGCFEGLSMYMEIEAFFRNLEIVLY